MPDEDVHGLHALYRLYRCREGRVFLACLFQDEWGTLCRTVQREELVADSRFSTPRHTMQMTKTWLPRSGRSSRGAPLANGKSC